MKYKRPSPFSAINKEELGEYADAIIDEDGDLYRIRAVVKGKFREHLGTGVEWYLVSYPNRKKPLEPKHVPIRRRETLLCLTALATLYESKKRVRVPRSDAPRNTGGDHGLFD